MTDRTPLQLFLSSAPTGSLIVDQQPSRCVHDGVTKSRFDALHLIRVVLHNDGDPSNFRFWPLLPEGTAIPTQDLHLQFRKLSGHIALSIRDLIPSHHTGFISAWPMPPSAPFTPFARRILGLFLQEQMATDPRVVAELAGLDDEQIYFGDGARDLDPKGTIFVPVTRLILSPGAKDQDEEVEGLKTLSNMLQEVETLIRMHPPANPLHINMINLRAHLRDALAKLVIQ